VTLRSCAMEYFH